MRGATRLSLLGLYLTATPLLAQVPYQRLLHAAADPGQWLTYSGDYTSRRYSPLAEIADSILR